MLKQITLFFNTGFNSINFPADPQTLYLFDNKKYPAMDLVQENFLSSIKIKATEDEIIDADYLRIGNAYYAINSYVMTSTDVVAFSVTQNAILSVGGIDELEYITGEVSRSTAIDSLDITDMDFNDYTIRDEMLSFSERRPTRKYRVFSKEDNVTTGVQYEKPWYGSSDKWYEAKGSEYILPIFSSAYDDTVPEEPDPSEQELLYDKAGAAIWATLQTAWVKKHQFNTEIEMSGHDIAHSIDLRYKLPGVGLYTGTDIVNAALVMNGFGIDNVIVDSYAIPKDFVDYDANGGHILRLAGKSNRALISVGANGEFLFPGSNIFNGLNPIIRKIIQNQAVEVTIESMVTGASNTVTFAEIDPDVNSAGNVSIKVDMIADPSPTGAPYYKLVVKDHYGDSGTVEGNAIDIMLGSIRGATWLEQPIVLTGYGRTRDSLIRNNSWALRTTMYQNTLDYNESIKSIDFWERLVNVASLGFVNSAKGSMNLDNARSDNRYDLLLNYDGTPESVMNSATRGSQRMGAANSANVGLALNFGTNLLSNVAGRTFATDRMAASEYQLSNDMLAQNRAEQLQEMISHPGIQAELRFPLSDSGQLLYGNGVLVSIKSMSVNDLFRYVRRLQQFGIACAGKMRRTLVMRTDNEPYNYIQANGVTVKYADDATVKRKINKQLLNAITNMFAAGFRIWYEKPTDEAYQRMYVKEDQ